MCVRNHRQLLENFRGKAQVTETLIAFQWIKVESRDLSKFDDEIGEG